VLFVIGVSRRGAHHASPSGFGTRRGRQDGCEPSLQPIFGHSIAPRLGDRPRELSRGIMSDGTLGPPLALRPLCEQFHYEAAR